MSAIADALVRTQKGQALAIQVKSKVAFERQQRYDRLYELAKETFPRYFIEIPRVLRKIGQISGNEQKTREAETVLINSMDSEIDWDIAKDLLIG